MIYWFEELGQEHNNSFGKKCANLGVMTRMGLAVPPGFAISIDLYREFVNATGTADRMSAFVGRLSDLKGERIAVFEEISVSLCGMIEQPEMPRSIVQAISSYYIMLCDKTGTENVAVSVRSAGTESRPGMFETYLNVQGIEDVLEKIKKVWASSYTPRAIAFRANRGLPLLGDELGVAVPKMVNARSSGIVFTVNPVDGDSRKILLEANWSLGEGVVSGGESVDGFVVDKDNLEISARNPGKKIRCVVPGKKGVDWVDVPADMQDMPCLSDEEVIEIAKVAKFAEKTLGCPQDMEWALDGDLEFPANLFWLQTRPAKTAGQKHMSTSKRISDMIAQKFGNL